MEKVEMGVGPAVLCLYLQLQRDSLLEKGNSICEIGSQEVTAEGFEGLVARLFKALGGPIPDEEAIWRLAHGGSSRDLMQTLGMTYMSIDTDGHHGAIVLDLNFDSVHSDRKAQFDIVTNCGTTEHVFNQANAFRVIHELVKVGGLMIHCVPFRGYARHCFFAYHPDLFEALARANGYELLGMWLTFGDSQGHLVPWNDRLLNDLTFGQNTNVLLTVAMKRRYNHQFQVPFQTVYEHSNADENAARYQYVVDGELLDGRTVKRIAVSKDEVPIALQEQLRALKRLTDEAQRAPFRSLLELTCREFIRRSVRMVRSI